MATSLLTVTECADYTATCTLNGPIELYHVVMTDDGPVEGLVTGGT